MGGTVKSMPDHNEGVWVAPTAEGEELGTRDRPFGDINRALAHARPGQTVVLACGVYEGDRTIQHSGTPDAPIHIVAEEPGRVVVSGACWFFYDVCDVVVSGLVFRDAPAGALSLIGACCRNALRDLVFEGCSRRKRPAATLYVGGSGARCNVVERCTFRRSSPEPENDLPLEQASVALMVAQGDRENDMANMNLIIRGNTFINYGYGIMLGTQDDATGQYGHRVEYNVFEHCRGDAITVKCGDTTIRGNMVTGAGRSGIALLAGMPSTVVGNRIRACTTGIRLCGSAHTVAHNCIVGCNGQAVHVSAAFDAGLDNASAVFVERNTVVDCGGAAGGTACGVRTDPGTSCIVRGNLFAGPGIPYRTPAANHDQTVLPSLFVDNIAVQGATVVDGCRQLEVVFADPAAFDFRNSSGYGAEGWAVATDMPQAEAATDDDGYRTAMAEAASAAADGAVAADELVSDAAGTGYFFFPELQDGEHPADA